MWLRWALAATLAVAAVAVAAIALATDDTSTAPPTPGFPNIPEGRKPVIFDVGLIAGSNPKEALRQAHDLGADAIRVLVPWNIVAPPDPSNDFRASDPDDPDYNFDYYDTALAQIHQLGMRALFAPTGPAPGWAAKPVEPAGVVDPDPREFGKFVSALAKRYSGHFVPAGETGPVQKVDLWTVWNEPNLSTFLQPQYRDGRPFSPLLYRKLYLAAQAAIHEQQPDAPILIGETAPTGGEQSVDPLTFTRQALCVNGDYQDLAHCPSPDESIDAIGWSAHPYPLVGEAPFEPVTNPHFVTMSSLSALESTLDGASGADKLPSDFPVYITEFGVQSFPDPNAVSLNDQAAFIAIAEHFAYQDPRVATFAQYLLNDDSPAAIPGQSYGGFESGLRLYDGTEKPAYSAFRLPLAVQRLGDGVSLWGLVQPYPHPTTVKIRYRNPGGPPRDLQTVDTDPVGVYTTNYGDFPDRRWQVIWRSPDDGSTYRTPWIRSYEFAAPTP
jgi:hypothetical protein